jgi:LPS-assembly protein
VSVDAESLSYDQKGEVLTARGGVTLTRGDTTLTADEVVYDRTTGRVEAQGHVVLSDPEATVEGDKGHLDLNEETGWVESASGSLPRNHFQLEAVRMEKQGEAKYSVADGIFTTCECGGLEKPSWSIQGDKTDVRVGGAGVVKGLKLRVKDVPVLWLPYFIFPANTDRSTGFLLPRVGFSNRRGFVYEQPFYWAINKSSDATFAVDVETRARIGILGEYRYALSRRAAGEFTGAYFNEQIRGRTRGTTEPGNTTDADIPENRWSVAGRHVSPFPGQSQFFLDVFTVSDDNFLREINNFAFDTNRDLALRSTRFTTSRTGVLKRWTRGYGIFESDYYQDLIDPQEVAVQRLPRVEAEKGVPLLGDHLIGRIAGEAANFYREEGFQGLRGDILPQLFMPMHLGRWISGSVTGSVRETAYHLTDREQVAYVVPTTPTVGKPLDEDFERFRVSPELERLDQNRPRELAEVHARMGTELSRVFPFPHFGFDKLKHTIEPEVQYLYVPAVGRPIVNNFALPACNTLLPRDQRPGVNCDAQLFSEGYLFDERDAINQRNFISYGFTTRLLVRTAAAAPAPPAPTPDSDEVEKLPDTEPAPEDAVDEDLLDDDQGDTEGPEADVLPAGLSRDTLPAGFVGPPAPLRRGTPAAAPASPAPREIVRASVLHGYDISRPLVQDSHLSDIDLGLRVTPLDWLGLTYNATASVQDSEVRGMAAGIVAREPWWTPSALARYQTASTVAVSYRFVENNVNSVLQPGDPTAVLFDRPGVNEIDGSVYLRLGNYVGFTFMSRYDLNQTPDTGPHFLERDYLLRLISRCNCWILDAGVSDKFNPDERVFRIQFTLVGLGSFGRSPMAHNYMGFAPLSGLTSGGLRPKSYGGYNQ